MERSADYPEFWVEVSTAKHKESIEGTFGYGLPAVDGSPPRQL